MKQRELRYLPARELRVSTAADGTKTLSGYAIVFGVRSQDLGGFQEVVSPGAVTETLSGAPTILLLNNHDSSQVLGNTRSGTLKVNTDSIGVRFNCNLDTRSSYANDLAISVERGDTGGCSFGFRTMKDSYTTENGVLLRTLEAIQIFELSVTSSPAYLQTQVDIRSCPRKFRKMLTRDLGDDGDECDCDCEECLSGNCLECSDPDCDSDNCEHGDDSARSVDLWKLNMQLAIALKK
jgi:uncharacterized protein